MTDWKKAAVATAVAVGIGAAGAAQARDQIRIVGSSTVYPFASYVVEEFGVTTDYSTPVIESTGSGGGLKLFCEGIDTNTPDITNASRRIKTSEFERCQENGVAEITEAKIGFDGIVIAQAKANPAINLTREQILLAVAAKVPQDGKLVDNPYTNWSQIDPSLPDREIMIYGPPATSGTRDAFEELVMEEASGDIEAYGGDYSTVRTDGPYIPSGENDNLIVQKLEQNTDAFGIFGYSFLEENRDTLQGATVDGVEPEPDAISSGEYPVSRSLYFYIKNGHVGEVPGLHEYAKLFMAEKMIGPHGFLKPLGLIPLPEELRQRNREAVEELKPLSLSDLK